MAKTQVIDSSDDTRVPFLRGILTRSLRDAGLGFDDAYQLASRVRQELSDKPAVSTVELRRHVLRHLRRDYAGEVAQRYQVRVHAPVTLSVRDAEHQLNPFSRSKLRRCLESAGLSAVKAADLSQRLFDYLLRRDITELSSAALGRLVHKWVLREHGEDLARRYLVWVDYLHRGRPLLLLIGGTTGCGKSSIATDLANRLEIVRTQSTDMLREVMRMMIPERLLPVLHTSSFSAWTRLPFAEKADPEARLAEGYRSQAELLSVPCEAVIQRAMKERVSLILEGVHVQPALVERLSADVDAVVVPLLLAVLKPEQLRRRIRGRSTRVPQRRAERYLEHFEEIWQLQSHLLSESDRAGLTIIPNEDREHTVRLAMAAVVDALAADFRATPRKVFSTPHIKGSEHLMSRPRG